LTPSPLGSTVSLSVQLRPVTSCVAIRDLSLIVVLEASSTTDQPAQQREQTKVGPEFSRTLMRVGGDCVELSDARRKVVNLSSGAFFHHVHTQSLEKISFTRELQFRKKWCRILDLAVSRCVDDEVQNLA
jgi:hypothetical protein